MTVLFAIALVVGLLLSWAVARRRRKATLAGLNADRPTFHVEPPTRRVSARKHEAL